MVHAQKNMVLPSNYGPKKHGITQIYGKKKNMVLPRCEPKKKHGSTNDTYL